MSLLGRDLSQYQVPLHQGTFSWKEKNLVRLWDEILQFEDKKQILDRSHLEMNREIAGTERWGRRAILDHCDRLADLAIKVWPGTLR